MVSFDFRGVKINESLRNLYYNNLDIPVRIKKYNSEGDTFVSI